MGPRETDSCRYPHTTSRLLAPSCRESKGAYALEVEARDGAPSARPNSGGQPNTGKYILEQAVSRRTLVQLEQPFLAE